MKTLKGVNFASHNLEDWDLSKIDLTDAIFSTACLRNTDFTDTIITGADFYLTTLTASGFTKEQLYSTASYKNKDLQRIRLGWDDHPNSIYEYYDANDLSGWDFSGQNLQNSCLGYVNLENTIFTNADLRGATMPGVKGSPIYKNTILADGTIKNFSMTSSADNFTIRKYTAPVSEASTFAMNETISAKINETSTVLNSTLTLEQGAEVEIINNAMLTFGEGSELYINTNLNGSSYISIESGAGLAFDGGIATINIIADESLLAEDCYTFAVMSWEDDSRVATLKDFVIDETLYLSVNGNKYNKDWYYIIQDNQFIVNVGTAVPEPSTYATIFAVLALGFVIYRRRK